MADSDSDDDLPIIELIKKRKRLELLKSSKQQDSKNNVIKPEKVVKPERAKSERVAAAEKGSSSSAKSSFATNNIAAEFYDTTKKGIFELLIVACIQNNIYLIFMVECCMYCICVN